MTSAPTSSYSTEPDDLNDSDDPMARYNSLISVNDIHRDNDMAYGCLFCRTNKERITAITIHEAFPEVRSITACKEKHKIINGRKTAVKEVFLPGYVFFEAPREMNVIASLGSRSASDNINRVLHDSDGNWQLMGDDERFALWLFHYDGMLGFSSAYREGDRIRIASGPLKDMEGHIIRVNKRAQRAEISIEFVHRRIDTWLSFELIDPIDAPLKGLVEGMMATCGGTSTSGG